MRQIQFRIAMAWRCICSGVEILDFKKAVSGGPTDASFYLRIINGLNGCPVKVSHTKNINDNILILNIVFDERKNVSLLILWNKT